MNETEELLRAKLRACQKLLGVWATQYPRSSLVKPTVKLIKEPLWSGSVRRHLGFYQSYRSLYENRNL
jgi:hypothetical protein